MQDKKTNLPEMMLEESRIEVIDSYEVSGIIRFVTMMQRGTTVQNEFLYVTLNLYFLLRTRRYSQISPIT